MRPRKLIAAYIPVLHRGYRQLLDRHRDAEQVLLFGDKVLENLGQDFDYLKRKDRLRALPVDDVKVALESWGFRVVVAEIPQQVKGVCEEFTTVVFPEEDFSRRVAELYISKPEIVFETIFLRWDKKNVLTPAEEGFDRMTTLSVFASSLVSEADRELMRLAIRESERSLDWWRQVGGVLVRNGSPFLMAHNDHVPEPQLPYILGDPRSVFKKGVHLELSTAEHAEAKLVAEAARRGISVEGASLYVTDFPCPPCAKLIASAGVSRCFFLRGYAVLDGVSILKDRGVEIIRIVPDQPQSLR